MGGILSVEMLEGICFGLDTMQSGVSHVLMCRKIVKSHL